TAETACVVSIPESLERLEDLFPVILRYPWAAVDNPDLDSVAVRAGRYLRSGVRRAMTNGVLHQIGDRPLQQSWVGVHLRSFLGDSNDHPGASGPQTGHRGRNHVGDIDWLNGEGQGTCLQTAHVESVLYQAS